MNNIFKITYSPWRYPCNWIPNIKLFGRKFKWSYQRIIKGFCDYDVWDLDIYYTNLMIDSLRQLANTTHGWPQGEKFPEFIDWQNYLKEIANKLEYSLDTSFEKDIPDNPYEIEFNNKILMKPDFLKNINKERTPEEQEICNNYWSAENSLAECRLESRNQALDMLKEVWDHLWD